MSDEKPVEWDPELVTTVHGRGKIQIPIKIRDWLGLKDGDKVAWDPADRSVTIYPAESVHLITKKNPKHALILKEGGK